MANKTPFKSINQDKMGNTVLVEGSVTIYDKPTAKIVMPQGPFHSGDKVLFRVEATWDAELGGASVLLIDGVECPLNEDSEYEWTAP